MMTSDPDAAPQWERIVSPQHEALGYAVLQSQWPRIASLESDLNGPFMTVEPGSSLALDMNYLGPWRSGSLHHGAMSAALDALLTARVMLGGDVPILPMLGLYPVLRTAIESAALAVYLIGPTDRATRLDRMIREASGEVHDQHTYAVVFDQDDADRKYGKQRASLAAVLAARPDLGLNLDKMRPARTTTIVRTGVETIEADPGNPRQGAMPLLSLWRLLSGLSHAKQWAMVHALERHDAIPDEATRTAQARFTSSVMFAGHATMRAVDAVEGARRLYGQRARFWARQPEDAAEPARAASEGA